MASSTASSSNFNASLTGGLPNHQSREPTHANNHFLGSEQALKPPPLSAAMARAVSGSSTASSASTQSPIDMSKFHPIEPLSLAEALVDDYKMHGGAPPPSSTTTLIIDIRPSTSFSLARIKGSINLCAPSTLLKRAGVTVDRIEEEMLSNEEDQKRFGAWRSGPRREESLDGTYNGNGNATSSDSKSVRMAHDKDGVASVTRIVVLDTDTRNVGDAGKPAAGGGGPCLTGLLRKFDLAGFAGELCWLVGGFNYFVSKMSQQRSGSMGLNDLVDRSSLQNSTKESSDVDLQKTPIAKLTREPSLRRSSMPHTQPDRSEAREAIKKKGSLVQPRGLPMEAFMPCSTVTGREGDGSSASSGALGLRQMASSATEPNMDLSSVQGKMGPPSGAACANPFFDNIRQIRELQHGVTEKIPMNIPPLSREQRNSLPGFLRRLVDLTDEDRADELAQAFYDIEKDEKERLIATMQQHVAESKLSNGEEMNGNAQPMQSPSTSVALQLSSPHCSVSKGFHCESIQSEASFPFSIAAALERGSENRYSNIWTYEHSRIRIASKTAPSGSSDPECSNYINGSYLEPGREFGCKRRYIATQAPLPCTFKTFWTIIWEQNVHVIAMVTREHESGRQQANNYWSDVQFAGGVGVKLLEEVTLDAHGQPVRVEDTAKLDDGGGNLFPSMSGGPAEDGRRKPAMIKRVIELTRETPSKPANTPRKILHLQFIDWPDYSVPDSCDSLLTYMDLAARGQHEADMHLRQEARTRGSTLSSLNSPSEVGPMVVHCSAGVGRTGTYVVIDSVLDILRKSRYALLRGGAASELGVWEDGSIAMRGRAPLDHSLSAWRHPPQRDGNASSSSSSGSSASSSNANLGANTADYFGASLANTVFDENTRTPRKSLKRELSPSAMDVDASETTDSTMARDVRSPPPLQRTRSDDVEEDEEDEPASLTMVADGIGDKSVAALFAANHQEFQGRRGSSGSGTETPSRAMSSMKITWDSNMSTPVKGVFPAGNAKAQRQATEPTPFFNSVVGPAVTGNATSSAPSFASASSHLGPNQQVLESVDLIRKAVETIREQRMSTVQTTRQFVFAYNAVLQALLRDAR